MGRHAYGDFDEFADCISGVAGRFVPTARATGDWWIERVRLGRIDVQQVQIGGATTFAGDGVAGYLALGMPITDSASIRIDGQGLADTTFVVVQSNQPFTSSARQLARWAGVTIPLQATADGSLLSEVGRLAVAPTANGTRRQSQRTLLEGIRNLVGRICADHETVNIVDPAAATAAQEEVLHTLARVLEVSSHANDRHIGRPQVSRTRVIARCLELIDASDGQPLFIDDLCTATQVSERTLRNIFQEFFGVGPMRLLKVRQLREIRSALLRADPFTDTVTKIAARFGVWDFSLFARNYRALYAEAPSETLRRPRERHSSYRSDDEGLAPTWIGYAARRFMFAPPVQEVAAAAASGDMPASGN
ncbi:MAG TPA: helix-turn-helix domain-containing protein [Povalibacter sp.]|nr:helix-turn-helix domain-containing protein [Povalibacter sp.]